MRYGSLPHQIIHRCGRDIELLPLSMLPQEANCFFVPIDLRQRQFLEVNVNLSV